MIEVRQTRAYSTWFEKLRDERAKARIVTRIRRFELGNLGDAKPVGGAVIEARIDYGPGYRLYLLRRDERLIVLLGGGDKGSQRRDIRAALAFAKEFEL